MLVGKPVTPHNARDVLLSSLCDTLTTSGWRAQEGQLVSRILNSLLSGMPLRLLVGLLGRFLPLLQSTAIEGAPPLKAADRNATRNHASAQLMHTMATIETWNNSIRCVAGSAEMYGLREFKLTFHPAITGLAHFHPRKIPPPRSRPEANTRFAPGTLIFLEVTLHPPQFELEGPSRHRGAHDGVWVAAQRGRRAFTLSTEPTTLPEGPWPVTPWGPRRTPALREIDSDLYDAAELLD